jgi:hypothetical protein
MTSPCIRKLDGAIVLAEATPERVNAYVRRICAECYEILPGTEIKEVAIRLEAPMLLGIRPRKRTVLLPFTKACHGTMLFEIPVDSEDILAIRALLGGQMSGT